MLDAVGTIVVHVRPAGSGQAVKAANQLIVAGAIGLLAEAIVFLEAHNVAVGPALEVLGAGLAGSTVLRHKGDAMRRRAFNPGFRAALHHKDLSIVTEAARQAGVVIPLGSTVAQLMTALVTDGKGGRDHGAAGRDRGSVRPRHLSVRQRAVANRLGRVAVRGRKVRTMPSAQGAGRD